MHIMLVYKLILELLGVLVDPIVYSLPRCIYCVLSFLFFFSIFVSLSLFFLFEILWVYLLQTLTRPYSSTWGDQGV